MEKAMISFIGRSNNAVLIKYACKYIESEQKDKLYGLLYRSFSFKGRSAEIKHLNIVEYFGSNKLLNNKRYKKLLFLLNSWKINYLALKEFKKKWKRD